MRGKGLVVTLCVLGCATDPGAGRPSRTPGASEFAEPPPDAEQALPDAPVPGSGEGRFTGKITQVDFGCAVDASCDLVVDGTKHVHFGHDTRAEGPSEWGDAQSLWSLMSAPDSGVGRTVEVYAASEGGGSYTIQGKRDFYIRVIER